MKKIPVKIPLEGNGSIFDVINDFIYTMECVTGGDVELKCDLKGHITVIFEKDKTITATNKNKPYPYDLDSLINNDVVYRGEEIQSSMIERKTKKV